MKFVKGERNKDWVKVYPALMDSMHMVLYMDLEL
jgi:hypothetical protein